MVRSPDLMSTQSAWRGELFRRSRPKSLISSAESDCRTKTKTKPMMRCFISIELTRDFIRSPPSRSAFGFPVHIAASRIAPFSTSLEKTELRSVNRRRCTFPCADQRVDAPTAGAVENHEQEHPAENNG